MFPTRASDPEEEPVPRAPSTATRAAPGTSGPRELFPAQMPVFLSLRWSFYRKAAPPGLTWLPVQEEGVLPAQGGSSGGHPEFLSPVSPDCSGPGALPAWDRVTLVPFVFVYFYLSTVSIEFMLVLSASGVQYSAVAFLYLPAGSPHSF